MSACLLAGEEAALRAGRSAGLAAGPSRSRPLARPQRGAAAQPGGRPLATKARCVPALVCRATGGDSDAITGMTADEARALLRVEPGASTFDDVVKAKAREMAAHSGDEERKMQIEVAYDVLLMESMKKRLSGNVASSVRFADVPKPKPRVQPQKLPGGVVVQAPNNKAATTQAAVFGLLAVWTLAQGFTAVPGSGDDVPGLQLALAAAAAVYFFREQKRFNLAPALAYTAGGLLLGALVGGALQNWLRVDIVPIGGMGSPAVFVSEFSLLALWAFCSFLA